MAANPPPFLSYLFLAALPVMLVGVVRDLRLVYRLRRVGVAALGRVVGQRRDKSRHVPMLRFPTLYGQPVEGESAAPQTSLECFDGDEVAVVYDPDQPTRFLLSHELTVGPLYLIGGIGLAIWLVLLLMVT
jgi:hypothetical protein